MTKATKKVTIYIICINMLIGTKIAEQMAASNCLAKHDQFLGLEADLSLLHIFCGALKAVVGQ